MSEEIDYAARVQRGIALMDVKWPNWATEIDLEKLDIADGDCCVTAQYYLSTGAEDEFQANWEYGRGLLGLDSLDYEEHGFNGAGWTTGIRVPEESYDILNGLWKAEIERRRAQGQDAPAEPEASA